MTKREVVVVAVVVACVAGMALPTAAAMQSATETETQTPSNEATDQNATANGSAPFGDQLTAFMQSNAAETNDTVESGMWVAAFENANESERARLATQRTGTLEKRLERLQERNRTLTERYENGSLSRTAYLAQASRLSGRIAALQASIDDTERVAGDAGVNATRLDQLRTNARNMTGPEVAGVARGVVAGGQGPPHARGNGPPGADGPPGANGPSGNNTGAEPDDKGNGPPENPGKANENADDSPGNGENADPNDGGGGADADDQGNDNSGGSDNRGGGNQGNGNGGPRNR